MIKTKNFIANTLLRGYTKYELAFLYSMLALQAIVFILVPDSPLNIIAGMAGILSVVMCAKGKIENFFVGFLQNITYTILSFQNQFYGEVLEQCFYVVTMIIGIFLWSRHLKENEDGSSTVKTKRFTLLQWVLSIAGTVLATIGLGYILDKVGSAQAYTDAATNIMAIFAQFMSIFRYREQWIWWIAIDIFCIKMWFVAGNWSMVTMYIAWTVNAIYGWYNWTKLNKGVN